MFNVVWTGSVFPYMKFFAASQIDQSGARFRFVANGCPPDQVELMERFRADHPHRVVEVMDVSDDMVAHGVALDRVRADRDDGPYFATIDPDIKAKAPFLDVFTGLLDAGAAAVTSGREVWSTDNLVPVDHPGVAGEHFYDRKGFVFGSPHLAIYARAALDATCERWGVGLGSAGPELSADASVALSKLGHEYRIYDTGKIVNALLQADGHRLEHEDLAQLVHIGGLSHYLAPAFYIEVDGREEPEWARWGADNPRLLVARQAAFALRRGCDGGSGGGVVPPLGPDADPSLVERLALAEREVVDMVERYRSW